jgi:hypothetical protein
MVQNRGAVVAFPDPDRTLTLWSECFWIAQHASFLDQIAEVIRVGLPDSGLGVLAEIELSEFFSEYGALPSSSAPEEDLSRFHTQLSQWFHSRYERLVPEYGLSRPYAAASRRIVSGHRRQKQRRAAGAS